jgi:hypothetical protein
MPNSSLDCPVWAIFVRPAAQLSVGADPTSLAFGKARQVGITREDGFCPLCVELRFDF